jgi:hypothetical protein
MSFYHGGLAQLARALALQAKGHRFDSDILHKTNVRIRKCEKVEMDLLDLKSSF